MPVLTPDMVRSSGNTWSQVRTPALERAAAAPFPTTDAEHWRYSRIDELSLSDFAPVPTPTSITGGGTPAVVTHVPADAASVDPSLADLFAVPSDDLEIFAALNYAHMDVVVVQVPRNAVVTEPIVVTHELSGTGNAFFPRLVIDAAENSEVTVVERFVSPDGETMLVVPSLDVRTAQSARVRYLGINQLGDAAWQIGEQMSSGHRDSDTLLATVALGGDYARVSTRADLLEQGGNTRQVALYFAGGTQMHDFRTLQRHAAPRTTSDLLFKGAVQDE
ncbi:MAG: SufD family Fe-S cluster assembly protein, partial [Ilumatobacteraceae bacterium]